jgi:hypothetical protein
LEIKCIDLDELEKNMLKPKIMKCGHKGYSQTIDGQPCCSICNCKDVADEEDIIDLTGRKAQCPHCNKIVDSSYSLPFFTPREKYNSEMDSYYCGCEGWD